MCCVKQFFSLIFIFALFIFIVELSPSSDGSSAPDDDSDSCESVLSTVNTAIINSQINKSSPSQLTEKPILSLKDYLHALDRHKSIDNCFLSPFSSDRLYLFDEIKKLTSHLFKITVQAEQPHTNGDDINSQHDKNIQNLHTTQTTTVDLATEPNTLNNVDVKNNGTCDGIGVDENNNKINDADETTMESPRIHPFSEIFRKFSSLADSGNDLSTVHWPVSQKRTKFRINQLSSRDVPIYKTEKPARLQKQNAVDDTKMFDEKFSGENDHKPMFDDHKNSIVELLESFERNRDRMFESHFRQKMMSNSISFDCGQLDMEQRSMSTIRSLFQIHATTGRNVKQIQAEIEAKNK